MQHETNAATRKIGLDLARAMAIVLVLVSHISGFGLIWAGRSVPHTVMMSGFFGVELFFALSGFLIGGLLLDLIERDVSFDGWARFIARRWLRTLPLYAVWIVVLALLSPPPARLLHHILAFGTASQNLLWPMPDDGWFAVSWSLTVEEWFYLLFSAALLGATARFGRARIVVWAVIGLFVLVPVALRLDVPLTSDWDTAVRKISLLRLDAIAYGVAAAALWRRRHPLFASPSVAMAVGLALVIIVGSQATFWPDEPVAWLRTTSLCLAPLGFALCLPALARLRWLPAEWLIRRTAALSYALYLVHFSVLEAAARLHTTPAFAVCLAVAAMLTIAAFLHRWVEMPVLARRPAQYPGQARRIPPPR